MADDALFSELGVRGVSAEAHSQRVLRAACGGGGSRADNAALQQARRLKKRLGAVEAELAVILEAVEDGDDGRVLAGFEEEQRRGRELQVAMASKRREELLGKQSRLQEELRKAIAVLPPGTDLDEPVIGEVTVQADRQSANGLAAAEVGSSSGAGSEKKTTSPAFSLQVADDDDLFDERPAGGGALVETERDRMIKKGLVTPFDNLTGFERRVHRKGGNRPPMPPLSGKVKELAAKVAGQMKALSSGKLKAKMLPVDEMPKAERPVTPYDKHYWRNTASGKAEVKRRRKITLPRRRKKLKIAAPRRSRQRDLLPGEGSVEGEDGRRRESVSGSESEYRPTDDSDEGDSDADGEPRRRRRGTASARAEVGEGEAEEAYVEEDAEGEFDDEDDDAYEARVEWYRREAPELGTTEEVEFDGGYRLPTPLWDKLFQYQQTGVKWLWELHTQRAGGIIGDEMGLGKTIQMSVYLAGLHHSGKLGTSLVVAPATVLRQWLCEMRAWYPPFRVIVLHQSMENPLGMRGSKEELLEKAWACDAGIVLTTYEGLRAYRELLLPLPWSYVVLDEGHKIRNPDADVTLVCKQVATVHRIILSGSPIQNRLQELWSLFDFVFPGKLGTLPVFQTEFAIPITIGGYTNANPIQVSTAFRCAITLRDLINPYLLRRKKADVNAELPSRTEQVLFCKLTPEQRDVYRAYLSSSDVEEIFSGRRQALQGIDILRKICNHPDLLDRVVKQHATDYGAPHASGKLTVTAKILGHWRAQGHKALLFTQTQQMLDIVESMVSAAGYRYHRMDGNTPVGQRSRLMHDFNNNAAVFVFLLTTKVGGLGVNLTGANRVLLYDPDWNPSTDMQARERAWRIGQKRDVTIYRLITSGTIEEKVYHRQIYKQFLTSKVLNDPKQRRFFTAKNIRDLFTLGEEYDRRTETERIFHEVDSNVRIEEYMPPPAESDSAAAYPETGGATGEAAAHGGPTEGRGSGGASLPRAGSTGSLRSHGSGDEGNDDARVLRDLMEGSGLMSAMDHAKIEGASQHDRQIIDQEAARIAQRAAQRLRESRQEMMAYRRDIAEPTWTGRSGSVGAPRFGRPLNPTRGGGSPQSAVGRSPSGGSTSGGDGLATGAPSSGALLAQMRSRRQEAAAVAVGGDAGVEEGDEEVSEAQTLAAQIVTYMQAEGGRVEGGRLVEHFRVEVGPERKALFRELLKNVANKQRRRECVHWVLKSDFAAPRGRVSE